MSTMTPSPYPLWPPSSREPPRGDRSRCFSATMGSVVGRPRSSSAQPAGIGFPQREATTSLPTATVVVAMSSTNGAWRPAGAANESGLVLSMPFPCESTPRRSVRTMWPAVISAAVRPIFIARRTSTTNSWRRVCVTGTGVSAIAEPSEPRDLDAGVLELVATVDRREDRRDALERPRVRERPDVHGPEPHRAPELGDRFLRRLVGAAEEEVALDRVVRLGELVGGDVVERGDQLRAWKERLSLLGRRARRGRRVEARAPERERDDRADHDLVAASLAHLGKGGRQPLRRHRENDHDAELRRLGVRLAHDRHLPGDLAQLGRLRFRALAVAGADDDRVTRHRPASGQPRALLARAAQDRDVHARALTERDRARGRARAASSLPHPVPAGGPGRSPRGSGRACP